MPLTLPYHPETEDWMLRRVLQDARRERCEVVLVRERAMRKVGDWTGLAVWRQTFR